MNTSSRFSAASPRIVRGAAWLGAACFPLLTVAQPTSSPADVFRHLSNDRWVAREITFAELGFSGPLVLDARDTHREIYLPVPRNVPLAGGEIKLNANYMRADGVRTTLLISLDTYPVSSRPFVLGKGDAGIVLGVDGAPRPSGFVRLGLDWGTALGADPLCTDARTVGNVLRIEPDSRFVYRYDGSAIRDLTTAWGALPTAPVILISSHNLSAESYDSAWRLGLALERAGKRSKIRVLPAVGDVVSLEELKIPRGLHGVPAFAVLAKGDKYKLKNAAEVGALLSLGQSGPLRADIIIADKAMVNELTQAFDALRTHLQSVAPDAVAPFADWRAHALDLAARPVASREIQLAHIFGSPAIVVASDVGAQAAGLFGTYWNRVALAPAMVVQVVGEPSGDSSAISLQYLGGKPGSFDVLAHADWHATFDIGAVAADGRVPGTLVLDVAAAPSAARTPPVVSVFMNDILIGAMQMTANGKRERITAPIPRYALAASNTLRLSFVRQLASDRCRETPEPYPVSVLPSSHMLLEKAAPSDDFTGMVSRYAKGAHVMVPAAYLADSQNTLPRVIRMAAATGVSPLNARFTAVRGETPAPGGSFLALELPFKDAKSKITLAGGHMVMTTNTGQTLLDVTGLNRVAIVEVVKIKGDVGVIYRSAGAEAPTMGKAVLLGKGDIALIGSNGLIREIRSDDLSGREMASEQDSPWALSRGYWWMLPILAFVFMIVLLVFASRRRRRAIERSNL